MAQIQRLIFQEKLDIFIPVEIKCTMHINDKWNAMNNEFNKKKSLTYQTLGAWPRYLDGNPNFSSIDWLDIFLCTCWLELIVTDAVRLVTLNRLWNDERATSKIIWKNDDMIKFQLYSNRIRRAAHYNCMYCILGCKTVISK